MLFSRLIPGITQRPQPLPGGLLLPQAVEGADCGVERLLLSRETVGGVVDAALNRRGSLNPREKFLNRVDDRLFSDIGADRHALGTVADWRAAVEGVAVLTRPNNHSCVAGAAAENAEPSKQPFRLRTAAARQRDSLKP